MTSPKELTPKLKEIAERVQTLIATSVSEDLKNLSILEFQTYIQENEATIKEELAKIKDIEVINLFVREVPAQHLKLDTFPDYVWNEVSFADNIAISSAVYCRLSEKLRGLPHIISQAIEYAGGLNSAISENIPPSVFRNKIKMELLFGKHDEFINLADEALFKDIDFVEKILLNEEIPNRESIDQYSYISILKRVPESLIDRALAERVTEKFQLGYGQIPNEFKEDPELAIKALNHHIANIEYIPENVLENRDVVMAAVRATKILDNFNHHPNDDYHPFGHLERLYKSKTFELLNSFEIEPYRIPGHSEEFIKLIEDRFEQILKAENTKKIDLTPPAPAPESAKEWNSGTTTGTNFKRIW